MTSAKPLAPVLHTPRLRLTLYSPTSTTDAAFFVHFLNDPQVIALIGDAGISTPAEWNQALTHWNLDPEVCNGHVLAPIYMLRIAAAGPESEIIGFTGLRQVLKLPDLGYGLLPRWWGKGFASEAAGEMLRYVMEEMGVRRLVGYTFVGHGDSVKVMVKIGMVHVGSVVLREEEGRECEMFIVQGMEGETLVLEDEEDGGEKMEAGMDVGDLSGGT